MNLTPKQEAFAQLVAKGKTQSDAFREAGYSTNSKKKKVIWEEASTLASNPKVNKRIYELKQTLVKKNLWTKEMSVKVLANIAINAERDGDKVSAVKELNLMHGYNEPSKIEFDLKWLLDMTPEQREAKRVGLEAKQPYIEQIRR